MMLVRARSQPESRERFAWWFRNVHLRDVEKIPGIAGVISGVTPGGTHLGFYSFESTGRVQEALQSPQAAYARGTWDQWSSKLEELFIEIWAPLSPLPIYQNAS